MASAGLDGDKIVSGVSFESGRVKDSTSAVHLLPAGRQHRHLGCSIMSYTVPASAAIDYPFEAMASFPVYAVEWIDNLHFIQPPERFLPNPSGHVEAARAAFLGAEWDGDGEIGLLWLPAFVFPIGLQPPWIGVVLWHVKQLEDGISWLLSPIELPFNGFVRWLR